MFTTIKRIISWCGAFRGKLYMGFVFSFFAYWFAAAPIVLSAYMLDRLIGTQRQGQTLEPRWIWLSALLVLLSVLLRFLFDYLRARYQETISYELVVRDRLAIGDALKRVSLGSFQGVSTGNILNSLTAGLTTLENMGIRMLDAFIGGYLNFLGLLLISRSSRANAPAEAQANRDLTGAALEYARGLSVVKSFGQGSAPVSAMDRSIQASEDAYLKVEWGFIPGNCLHLLALKCGTVGIAAAACFDGLSGALTLPTMLLVFLSFTMFNTLDPLSDSAHVLGVIDDAMDQVEALQVRHFINEQGKDASLTSYDIECRNVSFGYDDRTVLKNVSFRIPEKTSTAIVGFSGSGKTTLVDLLVRFYDVREGSILVGGHDLREFTCDSLLSNLSMVFQNVYLFHDTVRNNICFGRPGTTEGEMIEAASRACCHDFIMALPQGYDTVIGEGGGTLSGGEKQQISIARTILKDAPIIILDEATASVDPENEHLIQSALSALTRGKTVITIAHRLATIEQADQILVLQDGQIVQQDRHEDLIAQGGLYRRFAEVHSRAESWTIS